MMDETILYAAGFVALLAIAVSAAIIAVRRDGRNVGSLVKQLVIWVGIVGLLPLTSWAGATMLHPRANLRDLMDQRQRSQQAVTDTQETALRSKGHDEEMRLTKLIEEEERRFYGAMFWVGLPVGLAALVCGLLIRSVPVGGGLALGGLYTLGQGCYSYWDDMGDGLRFASLLVVLGTLVTLGLVKFGRPGGE